jgi:hypothetical protein
MIVKKHTENKRWNNKNRTKNRRWTQIFVEGMRFLLH